MSQTEKIVQVGIDKIYFPLNAKKQIDFFCYVVNTILRRGHIFYVQT